MGKLRLTAETDAQKKVLAYLEENASDALTEKIKNGNKTMAGCWSFIRGEARKKAIQQVAVIEDAEVYGWAVHYFEEDDIKETKIPDNAIEARRAANKAAAERAEQREKEYAARTAEKRAEEERKKAEKEEAERKLAEQAEAARIQKEREKAEKEARKAEEEERKRREREEKKSGAAAGQFSLFDLFGGEG